jgi:cell wall-associated NlpC family hydrolase
LRVPALFLPLVVVAVLIAAVPAQADPIEDKQAEAEQVLADIQALDSQLEHAIEAYNGATVKLEAIRADLRVNRHRLGVARGNLSQAQQRLGARLRDLYISGQGNSTLEVILGARSLDDLLNRIDTVDRVSDEDTQVLSEVRRFRTQVEHRAVVLRNARIQQERVVAERAAAKSRIEEGLAERARLLASIRSEIVRLQEEERRRQEWLLRQAQARLAAQRAAQQQALDDTVVGVTAETPEGTTVAPPARYGGAVGVALEYLGTPYVWGASGPSGFDCSGLVSYVYNQLGVSLPHHAASQWNQGVYVSRDQLQAGDLVFFDGLGHVGIYMGNDQFVHSPHTGDVVKISNMHDGWYSSSFVGGKRVLR